MNKTKTIAALNEKIDTLILDGATVGEEFKRLCNLHKSLTCSSTKKF